MQPTDQSGSGSRPSGGMRSRVAMLLFLIPAIAFPEETAQLHQEFRHLNIDDYSEAITPE